MNVPKPLRFEVDPKTVLKILNVLCTYYLHRLIARSRAYRILRHVLYHSAAKSEKETSQLARNGGARDREVHGAAMSTIISWKLTSKQPNLSSFNTGHRPTSWAYNLLTGTV